MCWARDNFDRMEQYRQEFNDLRITERRMIREENELENTVLMERRAGNFAHAEALQARLEVLRIFRGLCVEGSTELIQAAMAKHGSKTRKG